MKKAVVILISLTLFLAACSSSESAGEEAEQPRDVATAAEEGNHSPSTEGEEAADTAEGVGGRAQGETSVGVTDDHKTNSGAERGNNNASNGGQQRGGNESDATSEVRDADSRPLTKKEAEDLVRNYLQLEDRPEVKVQFDHEEDGRYVIHVYEIVGSGEESHTATLGWYYVDPKTQKIESMF